MFENLFSTQGLSLDRLKNFLAFADQNSIVAAAGGDIVRQSLISRQIRELSEFFGVELVKRHGRGLALTEAGRQLATITREQFGALSEFARDAKSLPSILKIAASTLIEPPTLHLLAFTAWATMGVASLEAIILCHEWPWWESWEAGRFVWWYSIHQLVPSIVWDSQDATLIAKSLELDPTTLLRDLSSNVVGPSSSTAITTTTTTVASSMDDPTAAAADPVVVATALLRLHFLETVRFFVAGFMMIASIVRAAGVSAGAFSVYEDRIRLGREPPLPLPPSDDNAHPAPGVVIRLCGRDSFTTEVSMNHMGVHLLPIFEHPDRVQHLVWKHSEQLHRPVYWCVKEHKYGSNYSWDQFPVDDWMLAGPWNKTSDETMTTTTTTIGPKNQRKILFLEADATNPHDPLALGNAALDLNLDDASQGFRRLQERFSRAHPPGEPKPFRTLRVYLGNSMEVSRTGGGHSYTLRPLDPRSLWLCQTKHYHRTHHQKNQEDKSDERRTNQTNETGKEGPSSRNTEELFDIVTPSVAGLIMDDPVLLDIAQRHGMAGVLSMLGGGVYDTPKTPEGNESQDRRQQQQQPQDVEMLRHVAKMAHMPRLVHMPTTAETVNAVEALITAGEVDATNCCAILERQGGVAALEYILQQKSDLVRGERHQEWIHEESNDYNDVRATTGQKNNEGHGNNNNNNNDPPPLNRWGEARKRRAGGGAGLQMICTSSIYDDLFRQVRIWARMGFTSAQIQKEIDVRFHKILDYSHEAQREQILGVTPENEVPTGDPWSTIPTEP